MMSSNKNTGLGRGLDALIPKNFDESLLVDSKERIQKLPVNDIQPNPGQPRKSFDQAALKELASSIKQYGLLQPLIVTPVKSGSYTIIAGERRWRAAKLAGIKVLPAIVRSLEELEQLEIALVENVQRVDLSPLEQALSIERLHQQFSLDYGQISQRLGKAESTLNNIVRLLQLPDSAKEALGNNQINEGHARAILALKDKAQRDELLKLITRHKWTVRQAENYVTAHKQGAVDSGEAKQRIKSTTPQTMRLGKLLNTKVTLKRTAKGGKLEITFKSETDLTRIIDKLSKS